MSAPRREILVTRAEPGAARTARLLEEHGYAPVIAPLLRVASIADAAPDLAGVQAVLFSSPNGARAWRALGAGTGIKALCVGEATAAEARRAGFADARSAEGDAEALAMMARSTLDPRAGALIWASGEDTARDISSGLRQAGFETRHVMLYRAEMADSLPTAAEQALRGKALAAVLFHSARGAEAFAGVARAAGLADRASRLAAVCMSARVADAARRLDWNTVVVADEPDEESLLAALDRAVSA